MCVFKKKILKEKMSIVRQDCVICILWTLHNWRLEMRDEFAAASFFRFPLGGVGAIPAFPGGLRIRWPVPPIPP